MNSLLGAHQQRQSRIRTQAGPPPQPGPAWEWDRGCVRGMLRAGPPSRLPGAQVHLLLRMRGLLPLQSRVLASCWGWEESCDARTGHVRGWPLRQLSRRWEDGCGEEQEEAGLRPEKQGAAWRD